MLTKYASPSTIGKGNALPIRPVPIGGDPIAFIAVDNGSTADFDIVQSYD